MNKLWMFDFNLRVHFREVRMKVPIAAVMTFFMLAPFFTAMAQDDDSFTLEEIAVTGTRIQGAGTVGSSVIGLDREAIKVSANQSIDNIIKELPAIMDLGVSEMSRQAAEGLDNAFFMNSANIHGIGPGSTLTLVGGHRVSDNGVGTDMNILPDTRG